MGPKLVSAMVAFVMLAGLPVPPPPTAAEPGGAPAQSASVPLVETARPGVDRLTACLAAERAIDELMRTPSVGLGDCTTGNGHTAAQMPDRHGRTRWNVTGQTAAETAEGRIVRSSWLVTIVDEGHGMYSSKVLDLTASPAVARSSGN